MADMHCMFLRCSTSRTNADKALLKDACFLNLIANSWERTAVAAAPGRRLCVFVCTVGRRRRFIVPGCVNQFRLIRFNGLTRAGFAGVQLVSDKATETGVLLTRSWRFVTAAVQLKAPKLFYWSKLVVFFIDFGFQDGCHVTQTTKQTWSSLQKKLWSNETQLRLTSWIKKLTFLPSLLENKQIVSLFTVGAPNKAVAATVAKGEANKGAEALAQMGRSFISGHVSNPRPRAMAREASVEPARGDFCCRGRKACDEPRAPFLHLCLICMAEKATCKQLLDTKDHLKQTG